MKDILVHVGHHKTASSWLQLSIFNKKLYGFWPVSVNQDDCREFGWEFLCGPNVEGFQGLLETPFSFNAKETIEKLEILCAKSRGMPVISHEDLSGHVYSGGYNKKEVADRLHSVVPNARILITIREQASMILSIYQHFLWDGGLCNIASFLKTYNEYQVSFFNLTHLKYDNIVRYYQELFGRDKVLVLTYEQFKYDVDKFMAELFLFNQIDLPKNYPWKQIGYINRRGASINALQAWTRLLNVFGSRNNLNARIGFGSTKWRLRLIRRLSYLVPSRIAAGHNRAQMSQIRSILGSYYAESNEKLGRIVDIDLPSLGYVVEDIGGGLGEGNSSCAKGNRKKHTSSPGSFLSQ